jgi:hypothetical protein
MGPISFHRSFHRAWRSAPLPGGSSILWITQGSHGWDLGLGVLVCLNSGDTICPQVFCPGTATGSRTCPGEVLTDPVPHLHWLWIVLTSFCCSLGPGSSRKCPGIGCCHMEWCKLRCNPAFKSQLSILRDTVKSQILLKIVSHRCFCARDKVRVSTYNLWRALRNYRGCPGCTENRSSPRISCSVMYDFSFWSCVFSLPSPPWHYHAQSFWRPLLSKSIRNILSLRPCSVPP